MDLSRITIRKTWQYEKPCSVHLDPAFKTQYKQLPVPPWQRLRMTDEETHLERIRQEMAEPPRFCDNPKCKLHGVFQNHEDIKWVTVHDEELHSLCVRRSPMTMNDELHLHTRNVSRRKWVGGDGKEKWFCDDCVGAIDTIMQMSPSHAKAMEHGGRQTASRMAMIAEDAAIDMARIAMPGCQAEVQEIMRRLHRSIRKELE